MLANGIRATRVKYVGRRASKTEQKKKIKKLGKKERKKKKKQTNTTHAVATAVHSGDEQWRRFSSHVCIFNDGSKNISYRRADSPPRSAHTLARDNAVSIRAAGVRAPHVASRAIVTSRRRAAAAAAVSTRAFVVDTTRERARARPGSDFTPSSRSSTRTGVVFSSVSPPPALKNNYTQ